MKSLPDGLSSSCVISFLKEMACHVRSKELLQKDLHQVYGDDEGYS